MSVEPVGRRWRHPGRRAAAARACRIEEPSRHSARVMPESRRRQVDAEGFDLFAFDHRQTGAGRRRNAPRSSVAFSSRPNRAPPSGVAAERRKQRRRPLDNRQVDRRADVGMVSPSPGQPFEQGGRQPHRKPGGLSAGSSPTASSDAGSRSPSRQAIERVGAPRDRGEQQETNAAMNREDAAMVVEADDRVDVAACAAGVCRSGPLPWSIARPAGSTSPIRPPGLRQRHRALDKQLVAVRVAVRLRRVDAGITREPQHGRYVGRESGAGVGRSGVGPDHVPGRIADHRVEAGVRPARAVGAEEHFGKLELPVKQAVRSARWRRRSAGSRRESPAAAHRCR